SPRLRSRVLLAVVAAFQPCRKPPRNMKWMLRLLLFVAFAAYAQAAAPAVMPMPVKMTIGSERLVIDNSFQIAVSGASDPRLDAAAARITARLSHQTGIPFLGPKANPTFRVECAARGNEYPTLGEDESYTLDVAAGGA